MEIEVLHSIAEWLSAFTYPAIFLSFILGGPIVTSSISFAASLGNFNIGIVFLIALLAEPTGDSFYYAVGRWGGRHVVTWFAKQFKLGHRLEQFETLVKNHTTKTIVVSKMTPLAPAPILMAAGIVKIPYRTFISTCLLVTVPQASVFVGIGYFFGSAYTHVANSLELGALVIVAGFITTYFTYYGYKKLNAVISKRFRD